MRLVKIDQCRPGMRLGKPIYNDKGKILLAKGAELRDRIILKLHKYNVTTVYIEDEASEGIEIIESIPEALRMEALNTITEGFQSLMDLSHSNSNLQGMMKSGRAIRSFQKVFKDILASLTDNQNALNLLASTKVHENYVFNHSLNVSIYACQLAIENGLPLKNIEEIGLGAMLHDLGKVHIPLDILNKPGELTKEEYALVKQHCEKGFNTLRKIHEIPLPVAHCAFQHHERIDGMGYPRGLKEDEIHKYAKIISVADVFDAVTNPRAFRPAVMPHRGLEILYTGSGSQFDTHQVNLFKDCIAIYPPGLTVTLNDGRTGIVTQYNYQAAGRPEVRIVKNEENENVAPYEINLGAMENLTLEIVMADALI
ncbi:HD-GYP domain-containing protein [Psychrobacillus sp. FJAT-21963]|uniref:HD-GYP domain-containing protein n=1 Tax=Psychrobacillus sp. FJAT-21963 TaxID=1712028 RepID=UPI0006FBB662|nr:HD-GYP domain-containing protein [Psychrobacillus sp. FJAT-21963]KQL35248.1 hypothetical protein AN959_09935 [Psychrobacillus sp. FJAT-21963]